MGKKQKKKKTDRRRRPEDRGARRVASRAFG